jgi:hypothetical protein
MDSLAVTRAYFQYLQFGQALPNDIQVDPAFLRAVSRYDKKVYEWELEILVKEIILNADYNNSSSGKTIKQWHYFSKAVNEIKDLENIISIKYANLFKENILLELYRISHRQFPWQSNPNLIWITRYYKIFSNSELNLIIQKNIGLTTKELYTLGLAIIGIYLNNFVLHYPPTLFIGGIDKLKFDRFLDHFCIDMVSVREKIKETQLYNQDFSYSFNQLRATPLIRTDYNKKDSLVCPIPTFLFRRFTDGIYYEICNEPAFSNPFGKSYQNYIGEALVKSITDSRYQILCETEYFVGKNKKQTVDWILTDSDCNLFIECKTKKLRAEAKILLEDNKILNEDLNLMADFIVQIYKSILDYLNNFYLNFPNNKKLNFPLVVTLEDWYLYGDKIIVQELDTMVAAKFDEIGIKKDLLKTMPYSVCSTDDFEKTMQVINKVGIKKFMTNKTNDEKRMWAFQPFMFNYFREEYNNAKELFPDDYREIHPAISGEN